MSEKKGFLFKIGERWSRPEIAWYTLPLLLTLNLVGSVLFFTYFGVDVGTVFWWLLLSTLCLMGKI